METVTPQRIRLRRTRGWRMPDNTIKVDRTTVWGNPFIVGKPMNPKMSAKWGFVVTGYHARDPFDAVQHFEIALRLHPGAIAAVRQRLAGKQLACWCKPQDPCHADVLIKVANE